MGLLQQAGTTTHPVTLGRAFNRHAGTGIDLALPVQRNVIAVFSHQDQDQDLGQQAGSGQATVDRAARG